MFIGLDSTDSVRGGCTTHVAIEVWRRLSHYGVRAGPRLVRLNPNVPYKTRGNGALCLELGHGVGTPTLAGVVRGVELWAYRTIEEPSPAEQAEIFDVARTVVDQLRSPDSGTGLVARGSQPDAGLYVEAVQSHVDRVPAPDGQQVATWGNGRGVLGAMAAMAWPAKRGSFELIAYRQASRWGTRRGLPLGLGAELDARAPSSFDNWDPAHGHLRVAPASPCPILAGVRGTQADELTKALPALDTEPVESWMTFVTNQGSGDHLRARSLGGLRPFDGAILAAEVAGVPQTKTGGHVFVPIVNDDVNAVAAAYEPTKELRNAVRGLDEGDQVLVEAAVHEDVRVLALEAITIEDGVPHIEVSAKCPCGGSAPSKGRRASRVCSRCSRLVVPETRPGPSSSRERVTVPVSIRRHLATPPNFASERLVLPAGGIAR